MRILSISFLIFSLLFLLPQNGQAIEKDDRCIVNYLSLPHPPSTPQILRQCYTHGCALYEHFELGVIPILFHNDEKRGQENDLRPAGRAGMVHDFQSYAVDKCPDSVVYKKCILDMLYLANLTMANGSVIENNFFRNDIILAVDFLPEAAFCEADYETKEKFYEFLQEGGGQCISDQKHFLDKIADCAVGNQVMDVPRPNLKTIEFLLNIQKCAPPLIRQCGKNGPVLESMFNDTIMASLMKSFQSYSEAVANYNDLETNMAASLCHHDNHIIFIGTVAIAYAIFLTLLTNFNNYQ